MASVDVITEPMAMQQLHEEMHLRHVLSLYQDELQPFLAMEPGLPKKPSVPDGSRLLWRDSELVTENSGLVHLGWFEILKPADASSVHHMVDEQ